MPRELVLVANARMPSQRAQSLQVAQMAAAFARQGARTTLLHARRHPTPTLPAGQDLFDYYAVDPAGALPRPTVEAVPCWDWIDRTPRRLQFAPARLQELSFGRNAARRVRRMPPDTLVFAREVETARALVDHHPRRAFLEVHRVPGGSHRRRWLRSAAAVCGGLVAISGGVQSDLEALGVDAARILVAHDGVEAGRFADLPERAAARHELDLDPEGPCVVYCGGLLGWKGVDLLIEAVQRLPGVQLVIAGGMDADVERLRPLARGSERIRFDGFQPPARVGLYLAAGDVGVVPNRSQPAISARYTSPLKVFEALAGGLPLVASDLPSLREILEPERDALFFRADDCEDLARVLDRILSDGALRAKLSARGRDRSREFTWDARAKRLLDWMETRG